MLGNRPTSKTLNLLQWGITVYIATLMIMSTTAVEALIEPYSIQSFQLAGIAGGGYDVDDATVELFMDNPTPWNYCVPNGTYSHTEAANFCNYPNLTRYLTPKLLTISFNATPGVSNPMNCSTWTQWHTTDTSNGKLLAPLGRFVDQNYSVAANQTTTFIGRMNGTSTTTSGWKYYFIRNTTSLNGFMCEDTKCKPFFDCPDYELETTNATSNYYPMCSCTCLSGHAGQYCEVPLNCSGRGALTGSGTTAKCTCNVAGTLGHGCQGLPSGSSTNVNTGGYNHEYTLYCEANAITYYTAKKRCDFANGTRFLATPYLTSQSSVIQPMVTLNASWVGLQSYYAEANLYFYGGRYKGVPLIATGMANRNVSVVITNSTFAVRDMNNPLNCYVCEQQTCSTSLDCVDANTDSVYGYYPLCTCICKTGSSGLRCQHTHTQTHSTTPTKSQPMTQSVQGTPSASFPMSMTLVAHEIVTPTISAQGTKTPTHTMLPPTTTTTTSTTTTLPPTTTTTTSTTSSSTTMPPSSTPTPNTTSTTDTTTTPTTTATTVPSTTTTTTTPTTTATTVTTAPSTTITTVLTTSPTTQAPTTTTTATTSPPSAPPASTCDIQLHDARIGALTSLFIVSQSEAAIQAGINITISISLNTSTTLLALGPIIGGVRVQLVRLSVAGNIKGFAEKLPTVMVTVTNYSTIQLSTSALPNYDIGEAEDLTIAISTAAIVGSVCVADEGDETVIGVLHVNFDEGASNTAVTTSIVGGAAAATGMAGMAGLAADQQALSAFAMMGCSNPSTNDSFGSIRVLSPFAIFNTYVGVILGNAAALLVVGIFQAGTLVVLRVCRRVRRQIELMATARFPALVLSASFAFHTGTAFAASQIVSETHKYASWEVSVGIIAFGYCVVYPVLLVAHPYLRVGRAYQVYAVDEWMAERRWPAWARHIVPQGIMFSAETRKAYGPYVSSYRAPAKQVWWTSYPIWTSMVVGIGGLFHPDTIPGCQALLCGLGLALVAIAAITMWRLPHRSTATSVLNAIAKVLLGMYLFAMAAAVGGSAAAVSATLALGYMQIAVTVLRVAHTITCMLFDHRMNESSSPLTAGWTHTINDRGMSKQFEFDGDTEELTAAAAERDNGLGDALAMEMENNGDANTQHALTRYKPPCSDDDNKEGYSIKDDDQDVTIDLDVDEDDELIDGAEDEECMTVEL